MAVCPNKITKWLKKASTDAFYFTLLLKTFFPSWFVPEKQ
ncbi:hypothetical protein N646_0362 [Vibrio alginolyticus NBRC 15630 = ATCC 17749]|uniref:Uncharacterized protein n=1 Tax=Vibrio alginolyticus (strain ATCC 17749 / DSM 2171 / NBRC 15630 / NCIMB 1903 / NCTC 12160 / XII-53) TaxID=1219076 RepID=A0A2I3BZK6_VIBAX|nr:hypothetical protein N646_0362 [Vibrio alginolyticus NBRC 15630 = ATCC 17749]